MMYQFLESGFSQTSSFIKRIQLCQLKGQEKRRTKNQFEIFWKSGGSDPTHIVISGYMISI